jgi:microcin C transport system substrate-binding protein
MKTRARSFPRLPFILALASVVSASAEQVFPPAGWQPAPDPLASTDATVGGEVSWFAGPQPQSFNYYLDNNTVNDLMGAMLYDTLLMLHPLTAEYTPALAREWVISDDKKTFTFRLDPRARWSDGRPITADDVAWTVTALTDPKNLTGSHKVLLEKFEPPVVVSSNEVRFICREVHWRNLGSIGGLYILPKHVFATKDFNKINFEFPVVSGPYRLVEFKEGVSSCLARRDDWWRWSDPRVRHTANFGTVIFRYFEERENAFEAFKKGLVDLFPVYTARMWVNETSGQRFDRNWVVKQKIQNYNPTGFQGFAMNMRRPPFNDLRVRQAMSHLLDRDKMNRTLMYSQYFLHRSYYEDLYTPTDPCPNAFFAFDKEKARRLLAEAGWKANPKTGVLEKDGATFTFSFLNREQSSDKFLAIYAEDLKDVGIELKIVQKDAAAWSKDMDEFNFDMTWAAWASGLFKDPESMWAAKEADRRGGNNITGFKDPRVDALVEEQRTIFDVTRRNEICRRVDALVAAQCPYALLWNLNYTRLLYWNKFGMPATVLSKYGDELSLFSYWWHDADSAADLADAMANGTALPARPAEVVFDRAFRRVSAAP